MSLCTPISPNAMMIENDNASGSARRRHLGEHVASGQGATRVVDKGRHPAHPQAGATAFEVAGVGLRSP